MRFTYTYRSSDGQRHTAEIEAESRDAAFARVRAELGIKPIRVVAVDGSIATDAKRGVGFPIWKTTVLVIIVATAVGILAWRVGLHSANDDVLIIKTPQGVIKCHIADPLPRQAIPGNRLRIEGERDKVFTNSVERFLSRFAEPGRATAFATNAEKPTEAEFKAILPIPVWVASNEFTEHIDLKRIVAGIKREMRAYIAGGGTTDRYLTELFKRQKLEISYRENAEKKLKEMIDRPKEAYDYWLKANAQLQTMGIYPLFLPDALQTYQMDFEIDE